MKKFKKQTYYEIFRPKEKLPLNLDSKPKYKGYIDNLTKSF